MVQDPKEATRERIERLKKEGAVEFEEGSNDKGAIPPPKVPVLKQGRAAASEVSKLLNLPHRSDTWISPVVAVLGCPELLGLSVVSEHHHMKSEHIWLQPDAGKDCTHPGCLHML